MDGKKVQINGTIRSSKCTGFVIGRSKIHPYTCKACYSEKRHQHMKIKQRETCVYKENEHRYGRRGVRHDYLSDKEKANGAKNMLEELQLKLKNSQSTELFVNTTEDKLITLCSNDEEEKFVQDICHLLKMKTFEKKIVHFKMLHNLAQKLRYGRGHKYSDLIIQISQLYKNLIGGTGHQMLAVSIF